MPREEPTPEEIDAVMQRMIQTPEEYGPEAMILAAIAATGETPTTTEMPTDESNSPLVSMSLITQRAEVYIDQGVDVMKAVELALDDAIETIEMAEDQEHHGPVGGLVST